MKKLVLLLGFIPFFSINAQDEVLYKLELPLNDEKKIEFFEIIEVPGKTQSQLFSTAKQWIAENYKSAKDVIQLDDKEAGKLIVKGFGQYHTEQNRAYVGYYFDLWHTIKIFCKEGKVRFAITDLVEQVEINSDFYLFDMESLIIDDLYKKNGKFNTSNAHKKEGVINYWNVNKINFKDYMLKSSKNDEW